MCDYKYHFNTHRFPIKSEEMPGLDHLHIAHTKTKLRVVVILNWTESAKAVSPLAALTQTDTSILLL